MKDCKPTEPKPLQNHLCNQPPLSGHKANAHRCRYQLRVLTRPVDTCAAVFLKIQTACPSRGSCAAGGILSRYTQGTPPNSPPGAQAPAVLRCQLLPDTSISLNADEKLGGHVLNLEGKEHAVGNDWDGQKPGVGGG